MPEGVESMRSRWHIRLSVFLRYKGSHCRSALGDGRGEGIAGAEGSGIALSGEVSGGLIPWISDILKMFMFHYMMPFISRMENREKYQIF